MRQTILRLTNLLGCLALIALFSAIGNAQFRAGVQGVVTDNAGGAVAGVNVTLTNTETNQSQTTTTSDEGFYRFSNLPPGIYTITAEKADFKKVVNENVKVDAETIRGVDIFSNPRTDRVHVIAHRSKNRAGPDFWFHKRNFPCSRSFFG